MTPELTELRDKITRKEFLLGIIGLGYVGLPLSLTFLNRNIAVLGFDLDTRKIDMLQAGVSYIKHIMIFKIYF